MTNDDIVSAIRDFFAAVGYAALILPRGWFGRPYDTFMTLTGSRASEEGLVLELDRQHVLRVDGSPQLTSTQDGLRLSGFTGLVWDWTEYGSAVSHHEEFMSGDVWLVPPTG